MSYLNLVEIPEVQSLLEVLVFRFNVKRVGTVTYVSFNADNDYAARVLDVILKGLKSLGGIEVWRKKRRVTLKIIHEDEESAKAYAEFYRNLRRHLKSRAKLLTALQKLARIGETEA